MGPRTRLHPSRRIKFTAMSAIIYTTPQIGCNKDKLMLSSRIFSVLGPLRCVRNIPSNVVRCLPTVMSSINFYEAFGGIIRHFWRGVKVRRSPALNNCVAAHQSIMAIFNLPVYYLRRIFCDFCLISSTCKPCPSCLDILVMSLGKTTHQITSLLNENTNNSVFPFVLKEMLFVIGLQMKTQNCVAVRYYTIAYNVVGMSKKTFSFLFFESKNSRFQQFLVYGILRKLATSRL